MVKFPLFVFDGINVTIFGFYVTPHVLEEQDILEGVYRCYDVEGYCIRLDASDPELNPQRIQLCSEEFRQALLTALRYSSLVLSDDISLEALQIRALQLYDID